MSSIPFSTKTTFAPLLITLLTMSCNICSSWSRNNWSWSGDFIEISALTSVFLISRASVSRSILASWTFFGMLVWTLSLSITMPSISSDASTLPPTFFSTLISSISALYLPFSLSITANMAFTARMAKTSFDASAPFPVIAVTAITGKGAEASKDVFAILAVNAILAVMDKENGKYKADIEDIKVEKKVGGSVEASELIEGMVIDKERAHTNMTKKVNDARIILLNEALEIKKTEVKAEITIKSPDQLQLFLDQEEQMLHDMVSKIIDSGANVVFVEKGIDDIAQHYLAKAGIYAARRVKKSDMEKLARATGAKIQTGLKEISESDLGKADLVEEKKLGEEAMTYVTGCHNPKAVSIILRGGTEHVVDEAERALHDALRVV